ncbi:hypothetical protein Tco_0228130 [Tanacetum coccineum]
MVDGTWCEESNVIKQEMVRYYKTLFTKRSRIRPRFYCDKVVKISDEDAGMLEGEIGEKELGLFMTSSMIDDNKDNNKISQRGELGTEESNVNHQQGSFFTRIIHSKPANSTLKQ